MKFLRQEIIFTNLVQFETNHKWHFEVKANKKVTSDRIKCRPTFVTINTRNKGCCSVHK